MMLIYYGKTHGIYRGKEEEVEGFRLLLLSELENKGQGEWGEGDVFF